MTQVMLDDVAASDKVFAERCAIVVHEVQAYMAAGLPVRAAIVAVQRIEDSATRAQGLEYGPFLNVGRVWELSGASGLRPATVQCKHGTLDPDHPHDPCMMCAVQREVRS